MTYFTKSILTTTFISGALLLGACNNNDEAEDNVLKTEVTEPNVNSQKSADSASEDQFSFNEFHLAVATEKNEEAITAEYKADSSLVIYKNMQEGVNTEGDEALDILEPKFSELNLTPDMTEDEVIEKVKQLFNIDKERKITLEVQFAEGDTKSYNYEN